MLTKALSFAAAAAMAVTLAVAPSAATAAVTVGQGCTGYQAGAGWWVQCQNGGPPAGNSSSGGQRCYWTTHIGREFPGFIQANPPPKGYIYLLGPVCPGDPSATAQFAQIYLVRLGGQLTAGALAQRAYAELRPPLPSPRTAPPRSSHHALVGMAVWYWVPVRMWAPITARAAAGGAWAVVTAVPQKLIFAPGAGMPAVSCPGPGTAYDPSRPAGGQHSACTYTYPAPSSLQSGGVDQVTVTITWAAQWQGSGGTGGTLPALTRSVSFPLRVTEGQGLVTGTSG